MPCSSALRVQLRQPGLIASLFKPSREAAPLFRILLAAQAKRTDGARTLSYVLGVVRWAGGCATTPLARFRFPATSRRPGEPHVRI